LTQDPDLSGIHNDLLSLIHPLKPDAELPGGA